jgi:serine/threonine protein kinase
MAVNVAEWKRLSPLLDAALDLPADERERWLAALPAEHRDLCDSLRELLSKRAHFETDDFLQRLPEFSAAPASILAVDGRVGPWRLLRELGSGGTSSVWLAERVDGAMQRKVALKLPHLGIVDRGIAERIARERDILASLEHPDIARLYDAGVDDHGRPFLALEFVQGLPPDEYCRAQQLDVREKLELFLNILRAVAYAHARLIVHRDLKPNNILIGEDSKVSLLDFGIARLLQPDVASAAQHTLSGSAALTPAYAAPEQFRGQPVTVATDVYSLGVILYELLAGVSPYAPDGRTVGAYENQVLHVEPPLMSRVARPADAGALRGDLDAIVAKALEKQAADRYASVEAFAQDVERHLAAQPIAARPRSFAYVARKFLRRNVLSLSVAASVLVVLAAALGVAAWQWRAAEKQRAVAVERLANSQAAEEFMSTVLIENMQPGQALTFEQLIARSEQIARDTGANDVRARIYATDFLANWYAANGFYRNAEDLLTRTVDSLPADSQRLGAGLRCTRAGLWAAFGRTAEAERVLADEIAAAQDDAVAASCLLSRAYVAMGDSNAPAALEFARAAGARYELAGVESVYTRAQILQAIGGAYGLTENFAESHAQYAQALKLLDESGRSRGRAAGRIRDDWSTIWMNSGNPRRALEELDRGWEIQHALAPTSEDSDRRLARRARLLAQLGRYPESLADSARARHLAEERGNTLILAQIQVGEGEVATLRGDFPTATAKLDAAVETMKRVELPPTNLYSLRERLTRAVLLGAEGRNDDARALYGHIIDSYAARGCCQPMTAFALSQRAELALRDGDATAAGHDAERARAFAPPADSASFSRFTGNAWYATGLVREAAHDALGARAAFAAAAVQFAGALGDTHAETRRARAALERVARAMATPDRPMS